jgi:hypothetical protein
MSTRIPKIGWTQKAGSSGLPEILPEAANDTKPNEANLREVVERARLLLDAAAGRGLAVGPPIVEAIVKIERGIETDIQPDPPTLAQFVSAYEALVEDHG